MAERSEEEEERTILWPLSLPESDLLSLMVSRPPATERDLKSPRLTVDFVVASWAVGGTAAGPMGLSFLRCA